MGNAKLYVNKNFKRKKRLCVLFDHLTPVWEVSNDVASLNTTEELDEGPCWTP